MEPSNIVLILEEEFCAGRDHLHGPAMRIIATLSPRDLVADHVIEHHEVTPIEIAKIAETEGKLLFNVLIVGITTKFKVLKAHHMSPYSRVHYHRQY